MRDQICRRCGTPAPPEGSDASARWTSPNDCPHHLYCPDCLTPSEEDTLLKIAEQMEEDQMLLDRLPGARRSVFLPEQRTRESASAPPAIPSPTPERRA